MFCGKCGSQLPDGVAFCPNCGAKVIKEAESEAVATDAAVNYAESVNNAPSVTPANKPTGKLLYTAKRSVFMYKKRFISLIVLVAAAALVVFGIIKEGTIYTGIAVAGGLVAAGCILTVVFTFIEASKSKIEFYDDKIIQKSGFFSTRESQSAMTPILGVSVYQSFGGKIFGYGNLHVDKVGKWDVHSNYIKKPYEVKKFLEGLINQTDFSKVGLHIHD